MYRGTEVTRSTFVIRHQGKSKDEFQYVVIELFGFCYTCDNHNN